MSWLTNKRRRGAVEALTGPVDPTPAADPGFALESGTIYQVQLGSDQPGEERIGARFVVGDDVFVVHWQGDKSEAPWVSLERPDSAAPQWNLFVGPMLEAFARGDHSQAHDIGRTAERNGATALELAYRPDSGTLFVRHGSFERQAVMQPYGLTPAKLLDPIPGLDPTDMAGPSGPFDRGAARL